MTLTKKIKYSQIISLLNYFLLFALLIVSALQTSVPKEAYQEMILSVTLLLLLPGLIKGSERAHIWLCFIILWYFTYAVVGLFLPTGALVKSLTVASTVIIFISSMMNVHWQKKSGSPI